MTLGTSLFCFFALLAAVWMVILAVSCLGKGEARWAFIYSTLAAYDLWLVLYRLAVR